MSTTTPDERSIEFIALDRVDSTNDEARRWVATHPEGGVFAIVARTQAAGVGRRGTPWHSPEGGLWMTVGIPVASAEALRGLGLRLGVALCEAVRSLLALHGAANSAVSLKWPNDVLVGGRKVLGCMSMLVGDSSRPWLLAGVGMNVNNRLEGIPAAVRARATSLADAAGAPCDFVLARNQIARAVLDAVRSAEPWDDWVARARRLLHGVGEDFESHGAEGRMVRGVLRGLDVQGRALIETEPGRIEALS